MPLAQFLRVPARPCLRIVLLALTLNLAASDPQSAAPPELNRQQQCLVEDGRLRSAILASARLSASERFAVEELQHFLEQISGAKIPVCDPEQPPPGEPPGTWIVVGQSTARGRHPALELATLGSEGFLIRTIRNDLVIAGGEKRGTLYGVYSFLESLGCRWWTDDASTVPRLPTLQVPAIDRRETPRLVYRDLLYQERWTPTLWGVRNKLTSMTGGACEIPER